jgi:hypothetical protein
VNPTLTVVFLPYLIAICLKIANLIKDKRTSLSALEDVITLPRPEAEQFNLTLPQRQLIVTHLSHANLKAVAAITSTSSMLAASILVIRYGSDIKLLVGLGFFVVFGLFLMSWVSPKKVYYFDQKSKLGIKRGVALTLTLCLLDLLLGVLAILAVSPQLAKDIPGPH